MVTGRLCFFCFCFFPPERQTTLSGDNLQPYWIAAHYRERTALQMTTDHGRGSSEAWTDHGKKGLGFLRSFEGGARILTSDTSTYSVEVPGSMPP